MVIGCESGLVNRAVYGYGEPMSHRAAGGGVRRVNGGGIRLRRGGAMPPIAIPTQGWNPRPPTAKKRRKKRK